MDLASRCSSIQSRCLLIITASKNASFCCNISLPSLAVYFHLDRWKRPRPTRETPSYPAGLELGLNEGRNLEAEADKGQPWRVSGREQVLVQGPHPHVIDGHMARLQERVGVAVA